MLKIDFVTLFPEMVLGAVGYSILGRAREAELASFGAVNPRDFATDKHRTVDDTPYGGGPGMLMKVEPVVAACESLGLTVLRSSDVTGREPDRNTETPQSPYTDPASQSSIVNRQSTAVVLTDPTGSPFTQATARELAACDHVVFLCGHYEGFDDRVGQMLATHTLSVGDFVLTGGELPALVMADAVVRLLPGVLGSEESLKRDSHSDGLLSAPQFTRPESFRGYETPKVLQSGDHKAIRNWKRGKSVELTRKLRPDLLSRAELDKDDLDMLSS